MNFFCQFEGFLLFLHCFNINACCFEISINCNKCLQLGEVKPFKYCFCKTCAQAEVVAMTIQGMFVRYVKAIDCKKNIIVYFYLV